jgi:hypothetical protein
VIPVTCGAPRLEERRTVTGTVDTSPGRYPVSWRRTVCPASTNKVTREEVRAHAVSSVSAVSSLHPFATTSSVPQAGPLKAVRTVSAIVPQVVTS